MRERRSQVSLPRALLVAERLPSLPEQIMACFDALPPPVQLLIFRLLPLDTRLRCVEVCRGWRRCLQDVEAWTHLVVPGRPDSFELSVRMLEAAVWRAGGRALTLDVSAADLDADEVLPYMRNGGPLASLRELRLDPGEVLRADDLFDLAAAAPELTLLACGVLWTEEHGRAMLRNEPPFETLRISTLHMDTSELEDDEQRAVFEEVAEAIKQHAHPEFKMLDIECDDVDHNDLRLIAEMCEAHDPPLRLILRDFGDLATVSQTFVLRMLQKNALTDFYAGIWVRRLFRHGKGATWAKFCVAVRDCSSLRSVYIEPSLVNTCLHGVHDLLDALVNHPSVETISSFDDDAGLQRHSPTPTTPLTVGRSTPLSYGLLALLKANAPALENISICDFGLDDASVAVVLRAVGRNTHLKSIMLGWRTGFWCQVKSPASPYLSVALCENELLPAVQQCRSLRAVTVRPNVRELDEMDMPMWPLESEYLEERLAIEAVQTCVYDRSRAAARAAARGWQRAWRAWTTPPVQP